MSNIDNISIKRNERTALSDKLFKAAYNITKPSYVPFYYVTIAKWNRSKNMLAEIAMNTHALGSDNIAYRGACMRWYFREGTPVNSIHITTVTPELTRHCKAFMSNRGWVDNIVIYSNLKYQYPHIMHKLKEKKVDRMVFKYVQEQIEEFSVQLIYRIIVEPIRNLIHYAVPVHFAGLIVKYEGYTILYTKSIDSFEVPATFEYYDENVIRSSKLDFLEKITDETVNHPNGSVILVRPVDGVNLIADHFLKIIYLLLRATNS